MGRYLLRRVLISIPVLLGITVIMFVIVNLAPGDPVTALLNPEQMANMGPEWVEQQKEKLGLNDPLPVRYLKWLRQTLHRQPRLLHRRPDAGARKDRRADRAHARADEVVIMVSIAVGIPLGVISALRQYSWIDYLLTVLGFPGGLDSRRSSLR